MNWGKELIAAAVGICTGILSGFGVGGGTLLVLYLTFVAGMPQRQAQGINLVYFICTALPAAIGHVRKGRVDNKPVLWAALAGGASAVLTAFLASEMETRLLRRLFGILLLLAGIRELIATVRPGDGKGSQDSSEE